MTDRQRLTALRVLVLGLLLSWLWKLGYWRFALLVHAGQQLDDPFFPGLLQRFDVLLVALIAPAISGLLALVLATPGRLAGALVGFATGSSILLLHQASYNDATFVTTLWCSLWSLWLWRATGRPQRCSHSADSSPLSLRAATLAQLLIGLWFFGGAVGKSTPGYLDGTVLYDIYFRDRPYWSFDLARSLWQGDTLREVARWYSRLIFVTECALATIPLWRPKPALHFSVLAMINIFVFNNLSLASVFASPIAVCMVTLRMLQREANIVSHPSSPRVRLVEALHTSRLSSNRARSSQARDSDNTMFGQTFPMRVRANMNNKLSALILKLRGDERGLSTVEYVVLLVLIVALAVAAWNAFGQNVLLKLTTSAATFDTNTQAPAN